MHENPIYIYSPNYSPFGGGPQALHWLCHLLNSIGFEAYINSEKLSGFLNTPRLSFEIIEEHKMRNSKAISIYPEVVLGNPFGTKRVIRYLLNSPGQRGPKFDVDKFWTSIERESEFIISFSNEFRIDGKSFPELFLPIVDERIFYENSVSEKRAGYLVYENRQTVTADMVPSWVTPYQMITMRAPVSPSELANLYRSSKGLIVFERTGALPEAMLCGCPVLIVPTQAFNFIPTFNYFANVGIGFGSDIDCLEWSKLTLTVFKKIYQAYRDSTPKKLEQIIGNANQFFDQRFL